MVNAFNDKWYVYMRQLLYIYKLVICSSLGELIFYRRDENSYSTNDAISFLINKERPIKFTKIQTKNWMF